MPNRILNDVTASIVVGGKIVGGPHYFHLGKPICGADMPEDAAMNVIALSWGPVIDCHECSAMAFPAEPEQEQRT